jgi:hypothetical protein
MRFLGETLAAICLGLMITAVACVIGSNAARAAAHKVWSHLDHTLARDLLICLDKARAWQCSQRFKHNASMLCERLHHPFWVNRLETLQNRVLHSRHRNGRTEIRLKHFSIKFARWEFLTLVLSQRGHLSSLRLMVMI